MTATDATVHPYPGGDTSLSRFALEAASLGYDRLLSTAGPACRMGGVEITPAVIIREQTLKGATRIIRKACESDVRPVIMVNARDVAFNRAVLSFPGLDVLRHLHKSQKPSFDHVSARMASERGVAIDIDIRPLLVTSGHHRQKVLKTYRDILGLHRKYGFMLTVSSNAWSWLEMRSTPDMAVICSLFGMTREETAAALSSPERLLTHESPVRVIS